jgi:hypothetical protein
MTENCNSEKQPGGLERRHYKTREFLIDALSMATAVLAVSHYKPESMLATIIVFVGAYVVAKVLVEYLWSISGSLFCLLSAAIYVSTLVMALNSLPAMLLSVFLPGIAQAYWIWAMWPATGTLFHPLTLSCVAWLTLLGITIFEQNLFCRLASATVKLARGAR